MKKANSGPTKPVFLLILGLLAARCFAATQNASSPPPAFPPPSWADTSSLPSRALSPSAVNGLVGLLGKRSFPQPPFATKMDGSWDFPIKGMPLTGFEGGRWDTTLPSEILGQTEDDSTLEENLGKVSEAPTVGKLQPSVVRPLISSHTEPMVSTAGGPSPKGKNLSSEELEWLKSDFLLDVQKHALSIFKNDSKSALQIALKWQAISQIFPQKIEEITMDAAKVNGFKDFQALVDFLIKADGNRISSP